MSKESKITVFKDLYKSTDIPFVRPLEVIVDRIKGVKNAALIEKIRNAETKEERTKLKKTLPAILFQGVFSQRNDDSCAEPSGLMITDYDKFPDESELKKEFHKIITNPYTVVAFRSPSGNGIKAVIKIPPCNKSEYKKYFKAFSEEFQSDYFDISNSNISRVCFDSYDPDCFVNYEAKVFNTQLKDEGYHVAEKVPILPIKNDSDIVDKIMQWNWGADFIEGERNQYIFNLAGAFCEYGVSKDYAIGYIDNNIRFGDFSEREMKTTIDSAYKKRNFDSKFFEDYSKREKVQSDFNKPKEEVLKKHDIDEETYNELKGEYDHEDFWYFEQDSKGRTKTSIDALKYKYFLERNGFKKFFPNGSQKPTWVHIKSNKVVETSVDRIKDFVLDYLVSNNEHDVWRKCVNYGNLFSENYLNMLESVELMMLKDKKGKSFIAFRNGILEITVNDFQVVDYMDVDGYIWENHIIDRDFKTVEDNNNQYKQFIYNISDGKPTAMECTLGYLLHGYKNKMNNKAVILNDEIISDNPEGGTGKGLLIQGLKQVRNVSILDGKSFDDKKSFPYQTVSSETEILVFDDVKKNFDFESKFSLVTEGMTLERKNKDAIKLSVEDSPKLVISTNYAIRGAGNSHDRRRHEVEIAQYYSKGLTPYTEFGGQLFDDWSLDEFCKFDNYMVHCVQTYLRMGLVQPQAKNLEKRKFIAETAMEFLEWVSDTDNIPVNIRLDKAEKFIQFTNEYKDYGKWLTRKKFNIWLSKYASFSGMEYIDGKSNSFRWFCISDGKDEIVMEDQVDF